MAFTVSTKLCLIRAFPYLGMSLEAEYENTLLSKKIIF